MSQEIESPAEIHADHRHWQRDISMWQDDIQRWQAQHKAALEQLEKAEEMIRQHGRALEVHVTSMGKIASGLEYHEKNLAESLHTASEPDLDDALLERHAEHANSFSKQRNAHERIKKHHHVAMAHVSSLDAALKAAM